MEILEEEEAARPVLVVLREARAAARQVAVEERPFVDAPTEIQEGWVAPLPEERAEDLVAVLAAKEAAAAAREEAVATLLTRRCAESTESTESTEPRSPLLVDSARMDSTPPRRFNQERLEHPAAAAAAAAQVAAIDTRRLPA